MAVPAGKGLNLDKLKQSLAQDNRTPKAGANTRRQVTTVVSQNRRTQRIISSIDDLPSLPSVVFEVLQLANDPNANAYDFDSYFRKDQALTARMLKLVNSSFFGLSTKVNSISRAIVILGFKTLKSVVIAASTSKYLDKNLKMYCYARGGLWMHSLGCAGIARHLGTKFFNVPADQAEELFVAGLLHDIGKIVIAPELAHHGDEFSVFRKKNPDFTLSQCEERVVGIDHAAAGRLLMEKWKLSALLAEAITLHHEFDGDTAQFNRIIQLANLICEDKNIGLVDEYPWKQEIPENLLASLGLGGEDLIEIYSGLDALLKDMAPLFKSMRES